MRNSYLLLFILLLITLHEGKSQNPIWGIPEEYYDSEGVDFQPLPTSPSGNLDDEESYQGGLALNTYGAYAAPNEDVLFFTKDFQIYDSEGWVVNEFMVNSQRKYGYTERLILPMGNDCERYAILFTASSDNPETYAGQNSQQRLYMAVYDRTAQNSFTGFAEGDLESFGTNTTLLDISDRDGPLYNTSTEYLYGFDNVPPEVQEDNSNIQLAATGLIDNCFHYVFVFDGKHLMRYRLTNANLVWDSFMTEVPRAAFESELRSEMELIQLDNGDYRIAIPYEPNGQDYGIAVYDLNPNGQIIGGSYLDIDEFGNDSNGNTAEMYGLEFDPTGQYLYVTHETNLNLPNPLDVYDVEDDHFETIPSLNGISDYQNSFIEVASNGKLYLLSSDYIGELDNVSNPGSLTFNDTRESVSSDHLNDAQTSISGQERYILPEQLDVNYPDLASMSCECCRTWTESVNSYTATTSDTWAPGTTNNPFNASSDVYIRDQLIIDPGVDITIDNMNFYFGPEAEVIVRREENSSTGAYLELTNGTVFTIDDRCPGQDFSSCGQSLDCDKERWQGIRVEGFENNTSQNWNSSTPLKT